MRKVAIITVLCVLLIAASAVEANSAPRKKPRHRRSVPTKVVKQHDNAKPEAAGKGNEASNYDPRSEKSSNEQERRPVQNINSKNTESNKAANPEVMRYFAGGHMDFGNLHIMANDNYQKLDIKEKARVIGLVNADAKARNIVVHVNKDTCEWWDAKGNSPELFDTWSTSDLQMKEFNALELQSRGNRKVFYSIGASGNYSDGNFTATVNLQLGTYLYKDKIDASVSLNAGYSGSSNSGNFTGDVGLSTRYYLPFHVKKLNMTPYVGAGVAWTFSPSSSFEARALAGTCWFIGPGSMDIGVQYGKNSHFMATIGYTFRPKF